MDIPCIDPQYMICVLLIAGASSCSPAQDIPPDNIQSELEVPELLSLSNTALYDTWLGRVRESDSTFVPGADVAIIRTRDEHAVQILRVTSEMTVGEVVDSASVAESGDILIARLVRRTKTGDSVVTLPLFIEEMDSWRIEPGDIIIAISYEARLEDGSQYDGVLKSIDRKPPTSRAGEVVYVAGTVKRPGWVSYSRGLTVESAIDDCGGITKRGALGITILRSRSTGYFKISVDLRPDYWRRLPLEVRDIVVPYPESL